MRLRVWAEFITPEELCAPRVVALLRRYRVQPCLALPYGRLSSGYARYLQTYMCEELEPALWPTMTDEQGYWPHEGNATEFSAYVRQIFHWAEREQVKIPWLAVDLETPYYQWQEQCRARGLSKITITMRHYKGNRNRTRFDQAAELYLSPQEYISGQGCRTLVPVLPLLELDLVKGGVKVQDYLETPVTPVKWDVISVMQYNSMLVGYSRGLIKPKDARRHLYHLALNARLLLGARASLSVGVTAAGKLGSEPFYRNAEEMRPDIEAALAAGIEDLAVFCLEGILNSARPETWFEMIRSALPVVPGRSRKMECVRSAAGLLYHLLP